jgi:PAS domain-containing protein
MNLPSPHNPVPTRSEGALTDAHRTAEHYRLIFETTFQFIGLLDTQGLLLEVNRRALDWVHAWREHVVDSSGPTSLRSMSASHAPTR